jgi:hypothetical protein
MIARRLIKRIAFLMLCVAIVAVASHGQAGAESPFSLQWSRTGTGVWTVSATDTVGNTYVARDGELAKYDASGTRVWGTAFNPCAPFACGSDYVNAMTLSASGNYVWIAGGAGATYDSDALYVAQYSSSGAFQWISSYASPAGHTVAFSVTSDGADSAYATGGVADHVGTFRSSDMVTVKYDVSGNQSWLNVFDNSPGGTPYSSGGQFVGVDTTGLVYVTGRWGQGGGQGGPALGFMIYGASSGNTVCSDRYSTGANNQDARGLVVIPSGGAFVTNASQPSFNHNYDIVTTRYDTGCGRSWLRSIDFGGDESPEWATSDGAGGLYIVGQTGGGMYTLRYDGSGNALWSATNPFLSTGNNWSRLAVDASGVYVTGHSPTPGPDGSWATVAYSPAGALRWTIITPGVPLVGADLPLSVGIANSGAIYVTTFDLSVGYLSKYSNAAPASVGGIAELPDFGAGPPASTTARAVGSGWSAATYAALAGGLAGAILVTGAGAWYARRRWLR